MLIKSCETCFCVGKRKRKICIALSLLVSVFVFWNVIMKYENGDILITENGTRLQRLVDNFLAQDLEFNAHVPNNRATTGTTNTTASAVINSTTSLNLCDELSPHLVGFRKVKLLAPNWETIRKEHYDLDIGGHYQPTTCRARNKVAILVPFRDRDEHLRIFLNNMIPILKRQQIEFNIFVIEQYGNEVFNRAMLFNVGFVEANRMFVHWDCFIFHDVDLLPENDHNSYNCPTHPHHISVAIENNKYKLHYETAFGGVTALTKEHFIKVNGFSNAFFGWGGEDDDMWNRIAWQGLTVSRPSPEVARYTRLKHKDQNANEDRYKLLKEGKQRYLTDGLSNLNYTLERVILERTHTLILAKLSKVGL